MAVGLDCGEQLRCQPHTRATLYEYECWNEERSLVTKRQISLGVEIERADAGRDSRNLLTRNKLLGANGNRGNSKSIFLVQLSTSRIGNH